MHGFMGISGDYKRRGLARRRQRNVKTPRISPGLFLYATTPPIKTKNFRKISLRCQMFRVSSYVQFSERLFCLLFDYLLGLKKKNPLKSRDFNCGRWDLNPHDIAATRSLVLLVCQFRHFRICAVRPITHPDDMKYYTISARSRQ